MAAASSKYKLVIVESPGEGQDHRQIPRAVAIRWRPRSGHVRDLPKSPDRRGHRITTSNRSISPSAAAATSSTASARKRARASKVYLATDPDREGEAISWHLANVLGIDETVACRIEFNEVTDEGRQGRREERRAAIDMRPRERAAGAPRARPPGGLQDQPAALGEGEKGPVRRARAVRRGEDDLRPREGNRRVHSRGILERRPASFSVRTARSLTAALRTPKTAKRRTYTLARTRERAARTRCNGADIVVSHHQKRASAARLPAAAVYHLATSSRKPARKLDFTTGRRPCRSPSSSTKAWTFEGEGTQGLVTYIRTDSTRISDEALTAVREYDSQTPMASDYLPDKPNIYKSRKSAQDAHEAIRPTDICAVARDRSRPPSRATSTASTS